MKKTAVKMIGFVAGLFVLLWCVSRILMFKDYDGIYSVTKFYELEDNTVDVLIIGSSHAYTDINTGILWREHGMASYVLAASAQPMWNSYYYLKEALKTQTPELIVLEGLGVTSEREFSGSDSLIIKNTYGLKWSKNRVEAIKASVPRERWIEFLTGYTQYHNRYAWLSEEDFAFHSERYENWKGVTLGMATEPCETPDIGVCTDCIDLSEKTERYYRAIIELAQENEIPLLIVVNPYANITQFDQEKYNAAQKIAEEYQVPFVNYTLMTEKLQIDYATDMVDESHLNYKGSCKLSAELGRYIAEHYDITDRRGDPKYDSWERDAAYLYALMEDAQLGEMDDAVQISEYVARENYDIFISIDRAYLAEEKEADAILKKLGISDAVYGGLWYVSEGKNIVWSSGNREASQYFEINRHDCGMKRVKNEEDGYDSTILIDNRNYAKVKNGMNVVIFDTITGTVADAFGIDADSGYSLCR